MISVNMHEAKTRLSELIRQIEERGEVVRLCRNGKPVAEIRASTEHAIKRLARHPDLAPLFINYDPLEPLANDEWPTEYR